jgi:osmotically-inducible protein OsmY
MILKTNLQHDVEEELLWDPRVHAEEIGVTVKDEIVQLDGHVSSLYEKWAAESAALRVNNVKAVANEIKVEVLDSDKRSDADIAGAAVTQLEWSCAIPDTVKVKVSNGWVTFEGTVNAPYQKDEAEKVLHALKGVKGIVNEIRLAPIVNVGVVKTEILDAFTRNAGIDPKTIQVETSIETSLFGARFAPGLNGLKPGVQLLPLRESRTWKTCSRSANSEKTAMTSRKSPPQNLEANHNELARIPLQRSPLFAQSEEIQKVRFGRQIKSTFTHRPGRIQEG